MSYLRSLCMIYLALAASLSGCTYSYTKEVSSTVLEEAGWGDKYRNQRINAFTLPAGSAVYMTYPASSAKISREIPRFRSQFQEAMVEVGISRGLRGIAGDYNEDFTQALTEAWEHRCDFIFTVVVTDLQSGNDKARKSNDGFRLLLNVYDVRSRKLLDTFSVETQRGLSIRARSANQFIYSSAATLIDRLYTPPRA